MALEHGTLELEGVSAVSSLKLPHASTLVAQYDRVRGNAANDEDYLTGFAE